ncbi:hypothetical protein R0K20_22435, partial [Staphylococcus sp. SIMBA_130]
LPLAQHITEWAASGGVTRKSVRKIQKILEEALEEVAPDESNVQAVSDSVLQKLEKESPGMIPWAIRLLSHPLADSVSGWIQTL